MPTSSLNLKHLTVGLCCKIISHQLTILFFGTSFFACRPTTFLDIQWCYEMSCHFANNFQIHTIKRAHVCVSVYVGVHSHRLGIWRRTISGDWAAKDWRSNPAGATSLRNFCKSSCAGCSSMFVCYKSGSVVLNSFEVIYLGACMWVPNRWSILKFWSN